MNISVLAVMAEYDKKASEYGKGVVENNLKETMEWCVFSDNDSLNSHNKRWSIEPKVGLDKRNIVDFIDFYPVGDSDDKKINNEATKRLRK